jgi:acyl-CoA synthetase (AMP-forming)/AMP-acid ligase II
MLISGGLNIHPAQVEDLMAACPGISEVAVVGIPDPVWGARLVALYCGDVDEADVGTWAAENIASALRPRDFRRVPSLPRTSLGKLRRRELGRLV